MRSKRMLALAGLGVGSLLSFMAACGSVNEPFFNVVGGVDAGADDGATTDASSDGATTDASSDDAATDATVQDSGPDGSVQDASVDATVTDAGADAAADAGQDSAIVDAGPVLPDGSSVVTVGDAQVIIPPLDPTLLGDGGIVLSDGGLANADGGALTPRQFRDLVNGITCQRASECCCPGCSAVDLATPGAGFSQSKCTTGLGANGLSFILIRNEEIPSANVVYDAEAAAQCLSLLNDAMRTCQSLAAADLLTLRGLCLRAYTSVNRLGSACVGAGDCAGAATCKMVDGGLRCVALSNIGDPCVGSSDCSARAVSGTPAAFCRSSDAGAACSAYNAVGAACTSDVSCGAGICVADSQGVKRCSDTLPFASSSDPASYCTKYLP